MSSDVVESNELWPNKGKVLKGHSKTALVGSVVRDGRSLSILLSDSVFFTHHHALSPHSRKGRRAKTFSYFESLSQKFTGKPHPSF